MKGMWRVVTGLFVFWLLVLLYMSATLYNTSDVNEQTEQQLSKALHELDLLRKQNQELTQLAGDLKDIQVILANKNSNTQQQIKEKVAAASEKLARVSPNDQPQPIRGIDTSHGLAGDGIAPSFEHELLRRKIENGVKEMWYYLRSQLNSLSDLGPRVLKETVKNILEEGADHQRTLLNDLHNLSMSNGHDVWREKEANELSDIVQRRLHLLQNPKDCSTAKKLVCNMNKGCGYGCQLHHVVYCFIIAYGTKRTFILESRGWRYSPGGWEKIFQPLSDTCTDRYGTSSRSWGNAAAIDDVQVVDLPIVDNLNPRPPYLPQTIPSDLAPRLTRLHGDPFVWWVGQFMKYLLRPSDTLSREIDEAKSRLGYRSPIVGVHVRRTDKVGTEAAFHSIDEYMMYVEEYYNLLSARQTIDQKRIYLATDDPNLLEETRKKYKSYEVISDNEFSRSASLSSRYTENSLHAIVLDIYFLSRSDYLVCTFSSQVCRVAYEIMQSLHPDASGRFRSLDDVYYFGGQHGHNQVALAAHKARRMDEIDMAVGDKIGIAGNHWNGYSKGKNKRTGRTGLYPSYKVAEDIRIADFPTYPEADSRRQTR